MKKALSLLLALVMCLSLFPVSVFADDGTDIEEPAEELTLEEPAAEEPEEIIELPEEEPETVLPGEEAVEPAEPAEELPAAEEVVDEPSEEELEASLAIDNILTEKYISDPVLLFALGEYFYNNYGMEELSAADAAEFTNPLYLDGYCISDASGLKYFKSIPGLCLDYSLITSLDVSFMTNLNELSVVDCASLTSLNIGSGDNKVPLDEVHLSGTGLTEIDVSGITSLYFLSCENCPNLKKIDVSGCSSLEDINADFSPVATLLLPAPSASALKGLSINSSALTSLDVKGQVSLQELDCGSSEFLAALDCSGCSALTYLKADGCALSRADLTGCQNIETLYLNANRLTYLDISSCKALSTVEIGSTSYYSQEVWERINAWTCGDYCCVDLAAQGLVAADASISVPDGVYSIGNCKYLLQDNNLNYVLTCTDGNSTGYDMYVSVYTDPCLGELFSVPEYMVLDTVDVEPTELKVTRNDTGEVLGAAELAAAGLNLRLSYSGGTGFVALPGEADEYNCMNKITPLSAGTSTLNWKLSLTGEGSILEGQIRVDVVDGQLSTPEAGAGVKAVSLLQSSAVVELYRTDYTELDLILELEQNLAPSLAKPAGVLKSEEEIPEAQDNGYAVASAEFTDSNAAAWLGLHPEGDGTLKIVPVYDMMEKAFNGTQKAPGSFTTKVKVTLADGGEFTTGTLKLMLKTSKPEIKFANVTLNSWPGIDPNLFASELWITSMKNGNEVLAVSVREMPDWASFGDPMIYYAGPAKAKLSGTATLECEVKGYAVKPLASVKITAKPTAPKFTLSDKSLTLYGTASDQAAFSFNVTAKNGYGYTQDINHYVKDFEFLRVTEGSGKKMTVSQVDDIFIVEKRENSTLVKLGLWREADEAHTYKLWFRCAGAERSITVNVKPVTAKPSLTLKLAKGYPGINLADVSSNVCFAVTGKNCGINTYVIYNDVDRLHYKGTFLAPDGTDVTSHFSWYKCGDGLVYRVADPTDLVAGKYTYTLAVELDSSGEGVWASGSCSFTVKNSTKVTAPSIKLTLSGSMESFFRSNSNVYINCKANGINSRYLPWNTVVYSDEACTNRLNSFHTSGLGSDEAHLKYIIAPSENPAPGTYYARIEYEGLVSNVAKFKVKSSAPKVYQSVKEVTLTAKDCRRDSTALRLYAPNTYARVITADMIAMDAASAEYFGATAKTGDDGWTDIRFNWKDGRIALKPGTVRTVKLYVYFGGYDPLNPPDYKPATVTVKVRVS